MAKRASKKSNSLVWEFPSRKSVRTEEGGKVFYKVTRTPHIRLIWAATQRTLIIFGYPIQLSRR